MATDRSAQPSDTGLAGALPPEPRVAMPVIWAFSAPIAALVAGLLVIALAPIVAGETPVDNRALLLGVLSGGLPTAIFPLVMLLAGKQTISTFGICVIASSMGRLLLTVFIAFGVSRLALDQPRAMFAGVLAVGLLALIAEKTAAVIVLRPTWNPTLTNNPNTNNPKPAESVGVDTNDQAANAGVASHA